MPYIGLLPFLRGLFKNLCSAEEGVNALHRASPISTMQIWKGLLLSIVCVNALHRASPISTVPGQI